MEEKSFEESIFLDEKITREHQFFLEMEKII